MHNICKSVDSVFPAVLTISQFIFEANPAAMQEAEKLHHQRLYLFVRGSGHLCFDDKAAAHVRGQRQICRKRSIS